MLTDVVVPHQTLTEFGEKLLGAAGVPAAKARLVSVSLTAASLRGVDSHGMQLLPFYIDRLRRGSIDVLAEGRIVSENGACLVYDGQNGIGQWIAAICSDHAIRLARAHGLGMVVSRESNHFGAAAYWGQRISAAGMIGIVTCTASASVCPWQGREKRFGTNPVCVTVPGSPQVWLLDMATTTVAMGKIYKADISRQPEIPSGWALDAGGRPTVNTQEALKGSLMPLGGYKGYGLAMMAEILSAVLSGGVFGPQIANVRSADRPMRVSQMFLAIDAARFLPPEEFEARMEAYTGLMKSSAPAAGFDEVLVAGDPEWRYEAERKEKGIPLATALWDRFLAAAKDLGVEAPPL